MVDPFTAGGAAMAVFGTHQGGKAVARLLGPAADEVAESVRRWTAWQVGNVERVATNAAKKTATEEPGAVAPRVAMRVFEDASSSDQTVVSEYLGGVLASSKTEDGTDDAGVPWSSLVGRLASRHLRLHYVLYEVTRQCWVGKGAEAKDICASEVFVPFSSLLSILEVDAEELMEQFSESFYTLQRELLVGESFFYTLSGDKLPEETPNRYRSKNWPQYGGLMFFPSRSGIALYLWGHGLGRVHINKFADPDLNPQVVDLHISMPEGFSLLRDMEERQSDDVE